MYTQKLSTLALAGLAAIFLTMTPVLAQSDAAPPKPVVLTAKDKLPASVTQLTIIDREEGDTKGKVAQTGFAILVHYTGWLYDPSKPDGKGEQFDSSRARPVPFSFLLGAGRVIKGWEQGLLGMKAGGKRTLIIPPALAYGDRERPKIPKNSTLLFDVEVADVIDPSGNAMTSASPAPAAPPPAAASGPVRLKGNDPMPKEVKDLTLIERAAGDGKMAIPGMSVQVHYTGWLFDPSKPDGKGNKFDSSVDRGQAFSFPLGGGRVIKGWDQGVAGMKIGGKRTLLIPPQFGYGERGAGGVIPPNATLLFDVELLATSP